MSVILASQSSGRLAMLRNAGVDVIPIAAAVDEDAIKAGLVAAGAKVRDIADALAEAKAVKTSRKNPDALVIGCDQLLVTADGDLLSKPESPDDARAHLRALSASVHRLVSAVVICELGFPVWRTVDTAKLVMRPLSGAFIDDYVDQHWDQIQNCVGCYQIEAEGAQLFTSISGSQFTVIGMPLLPVLDYLRLRGLLKT
ncbi:MAG: Maf family protein [Sphingorhabdus sp.]